MKMKTTILVLTAMISLFGCDKTSSPDGRSQLRDKQLSEKIDALTKKQIIILDSLKVLDEKIKFLAQTK